MQFLELAEFRKELDDPKFLSYVVRRYLSTGSYDSVCIEYGLHANTFDKIFAADEEFENKFLDTLEELSKKTLRSSSTAAAARALSELIAYIDGLDPEKVDVPACKAILGYHSKQFPMKKPGKDEKEDEIDKLFGLLDKDEQPEKDS